MRKFFVILLPVLGLALLAAGGWYWWMAVDTRPSWRDQLAQARLHIPADEPAVWREFDRITTALEALPADGDHCGLIHGDFELDNLRWPVRVDEEERDARENGALAAPGMLDFDDCSTHWYAADMAFALRDLFDSGAGVSNALVETFVQGYRAYRPLGDELLATMPLFSRLSRLLTYATVMRSLDLAESADHPQWLRALCRRLQASTAAYAASMERDGTVHRAPPTR